MFILAVQNGVLKQYLIVLQNYRMRLVMQNYQQHKVNLEDQVYKPLRPATMLKNYQTSIFNLVQAIIQPRPGLELILPRLHTSTKTIDNSFTAKAKQQQLVLPVT